MQRYMDNKRGTHNVYLFYCSWHLFFVIIVEILSVM